MKTYECKNKNCDLGKNAPGRFTGNGGVCPNCGKKA
jgi:hypothetical protein